MVVGGGGRIWRGEGVGLRWVGHDRENAGQRSVPVAEDLYDQSV